MSLHFNCPIPCPLNHPIPSIPFSCEHRKCAMRLAPARRGPIRFTSLPNSIVLHSCSGKDPHEDKLYNVRVEEQELGSLVALGSRVRLHGASGVSRSLREQNVFERSHLESLLTIGSCISEQNNIPRTVSWQEMCRKKGASQPIHPCPCRR